MGSDVSHFIVSLIVQGKDGYRMASLSFNESSSLLLSLVYIQNRALSPVLQKISEFVSNIVNLSVMISVSDKLKFHTL